MCGIAGWVDADAGSAAEDIRDVVQQMATSLGHRGPDGSGAWVDAAAGVALGHRRLSVLDTSPAGAQPMVSGCGRYVLTYNGEIYNFRALRADLERAGRRFRGSSDTEVLLEAVAAWGLRATLERANGMFALALWDRSASCLYLARDRLGEKPLYYGRFGRRLLFGSELKALRVHPAFDARLDRDALALYLRFAYVPGPHTIYRGVRKLPPGHVLAVSARGSVDPASEPYWSLEDAVRRAVGAPFEGEPSDAVDELDRLLRDSVRLRLESDVPLGAFLSGGVDSTAVVAATQAESSRPVRTFTAAFDESSHDEAAHAARIAAYLGTDHVEARLSPHEALDLIPRLPELYDEPFADPSQLPTALIAAVARDHVTVALSGDGGDEIFGGYNRYTHGPSVWARTTRMPSTLRGAVARCLMAPSHQAWGRLLGVAESVLPGAWQQRNPADKVQKLAGLVAADDEAGMRRVLVSHWPQPASMVDRAKEPLTAATDPEAGAWLHHAAERLMYVDTLTELPDCMLTKVDRASMASSLEMRVPLLDHRLVEYAWRLPLHHRIAGQQGKWVLRQVLDRYVPRALLDRPKMGFDPPIGAWLRGPLRSWAEELLSDRALADGDLLDPGPIRHRWQEHVRGRRNWDYQLWTVLVFQAWREHSNVTLD